MWNTFCQLVLESQGWVALLTLILTLSLGYYQSVKIKRLEAEHARNNFRFSQVFGETEKIIRDLYQKILTLTDNITGTLEFNDYIDYTQIPPPIAERIAKDLRELSSAFYPNRIYLSEDTADMVQKYIFHMNDIFKAESQLRQYKKISISLRKPKDIAEMIENAKVNRDELFGNTHEMLAAVESDFRFILGFPKKEKTTLQKTKDIAAKIKKKWADAV